MRVEELRRVIDLANRTDAVAKAYCGNVYKGNTALCADDILKEPVAVIEFLLAIIERR